MDLLPIRARATEGSAYASELFFIEREKFSPEYFVESILPFVRGIDRNNSNSHGESPSLRMYAEILAQIKKYTAEIEKFKILYPNAKINLQINFKIPNYLQIEDKVCFTFPITREPDLYATDLFQAYGIPQRELLTIFIFYIRESILSYIKESICNQSDLESADFQQSEPVVRKAEINSLNQHLLSYEAPGRISILKETAEKKRKKKTAGSAMNTSM